MAHGNAHAHDPKAEPHPLVGHLVPFWLLFAVGGSIGVPTHVGRNRTATRAVGCMRPMPTPASPRVICMLNDVEMAVDTRRPGDLGERLRIGGISEHQEPAVQGFDGL